MVSGLDGIKVVETAGFVAGPMAGRLLADWGADVVCIHNPTKGDEAERLANNTLVSDRRIAANINYEAEKCNRNKRSIYIDISQDIGRDILNNMLNKADILISNYRPREVEKFRLDYATLCQSNPRLIYANLSGYGSKGPQKNLPALESSGYFARTGLFHVLSSPGQPPPVSPLHSGDNIAGLVLAYGILAALYMREKTGEGQLVETSLYAAGLFQNSFDISAALITGKDRQGIDREHVRNVMMNFYRTKDGRWIRLAMQTDLYWPKLCKALGREDLENNPKFSSMEVRVENHADIYKIMDEIFMGKTSEEWREPLNNSGLIWAPMQNLPEVCSDPQARANDYFVPFDHPVYGTIELVSNPVKLSKTPWILKTPAPKFGQHTDEVLIENGYTEKAIKEFKQMGVVK